MDKPKTNEEWAADVNRRLRALENSILPWQVSVGRHGDLVAYNIETGQRTVIAALARDTQVKPKG